MSSQSSRFVLGFWALGGAMLAAGCSSGARPTEGVQSASSALTGTVTIDSSCYDTAPTCPAQADGYPAPPLPPFAPDTTANVARNALVAAAYARIAVNSPAFHECLQTVMSKATSVPGAGVTGPYLACARDPRPSTFDTVMSAALSPNETRISCNYCAINSNDAGGARLSGIDGAGREPITLGNQLSHMTSPALCAVNGNTAPCVDDSTLSAAASAIAQGVMYTHGYGQVADSVNGLNNVNVGDWYFTDPNTLTERYYTLDDFCGIQPAPTPNSGIAPHGPTLFPTPGLHPVYNSSIPYEVGECVRAVLDWSEQSTHMHDNCESGFAGLNLVDTVLEGTASTVPMHCVKDPYSGAGGPIVLPQAPTCYLTPSPTPNALLTLDCGSNNPYPIHLETRPLISTGAWTSGLVPYNSNLDYRVCAASSYGQACARPVGCPYRVLADTKNAVTTFSWMSAPWVDHYSVRRNDGHYPLPISFPIVGPEIPSTFIEENMPAEDPSTEYALCAMNTRPPGSNQALECCSTPIKPTRTTCFTTVKCRVKGKDVFATDTDDPATWCASIGGTMTKKETCTVDKN